VVARDDTAPRENASVSAYEVFAIRYATREATKSESYYRFASYHDEDAQIGMDYFFWVLRSGERVVLVDCGYGIEAGERRGRRTLVPPIDALAQAGVVPASVGHLLLTHLHYDHTGLASLFGGTPTTVHRRELEFWTSPLAAKPQFSHLIESDELAAVTSSSQLTVLDGRSATVDDGVEAICVGGHSPGQLILVVDAQTGPVILASDAIHYYEELELDRPFEVFVDLAAMYEGYETLRELTARPDAVLVAGHDPEVCRRFPSDDGIVYRIA
jgi:glyoxylase-like metal-dependent hydrolase (beta-lactamase superfamily II)